MIDRQVKGHADIERDWGGFNHFLWHRIPAEIQLKSWHYGLFGLVFLLLIPYPLFHGLDALTLRIYDEARRGVNAYEMLHDGNLIVSHYDGKPDMWGTKPTLLVMLQSGLMWLLGPGELAVRLPSAIAGLLTGLLILYFSHKYLKNSLFGLIWAVILITFNGFVDFHGTRTGDFDALLTLFMFLYALYFFLFTQNRSHKYILLSAVFVTLAAMTKGVAGLFFLPALLVWALVTKSLKDILSSRYTLLGLGIFILAVGGYYFARELMNPGYLKAVTSNELAGRYMKALEGNDFQTSYYLDGFIYPRLQKWAVFILPGLAAGFFLKDKFAKNLHLFGILLIITHLLVITISRTKLPWYDLPEMPFLALMIANFIWPVVIILNRIAQFFNVRLLMLLPVIFLGLIFYEPVRLTFKEANYIQERPWYLQSQEVAKFLREGVRGQRNLDGFVLVHEDYDAQCVFYLNLLKDKGQHVIRKSKDQLLSGERVIAHQESVKDYIEAGYSCQILDSLTFVKVYSIY